MSNIYIYTQDCIDERDFINICYPTHKNHQTYSSGLWDSRSSSKNNIFEIPYTDHIHHDTSDASEYVKSIFTNKIPINILLNDINWNITTDLISSINFLHQHIPTSKQFMIFSMARSGTVFLETLLQKKSYKSIGFHYSNNGDSKKIIQNCINNPMTSIFFLYRKNFWEWITSMHIAKNYGSIHYNTVTDTSFNTINITQNDLYVYYDLFNSMINFWCNLRVILNNYGSFLFTYEYLVDNFQSVSTHRKINYNKSEIISNHNNMNQWFNDNMLSLFKTSEQNMLSHLSKMNVTMVSESKLVL